MARKKPDLSLRWSRRENDVLGEFRDPACRQDMSLMFLHLHSERPCYGKNEVIPSFLAELEARGYDMTTLKFSISKKQGQQQ